IRVIVYHCRSTNSNKQETRAAMLSRNQKAVLSVGGLAGFFLLVGGLLGLFYAPKFINDQVIQRDVIGYDTLSNGTRVLNDMTKKWIHPPYEMILHIWMYSVQNEAAFLAGEQKLRLSQKGPYAFIEDQEKTFEFSPTEERIFYRNRHRYFFSQEHSCSDCFLNDTVTIPNVLFQKLVDFAKKNIFAKAAIETLLFTEGRETPFVTIKVGEALFEGYDDPLISKACSNVVLKIICKTAKIPERIGFFYGQNNTDDGLYEVGTGKNGPSDLGKMYSWNNATSLPDPFWDSPFARAINGTDGQLFPPLLKKDVVLPLFASQACRSVKMAYVDDSEYLGVNSWRYSTPISMYDPTLPDNHIFCHVDSTVEYFNDTEVQPKGCLPAGMIDLSKCQPGEPRVYLSQAHFYMSPDKVRTAVEGVDEGKAERDTTYVDIEPTSGVPIYAKRVMQVNVGMKKGNLNKLSATHNVIVPVFWVNETASVDPETRNQLANQLQLAKRWAFFGGVAALIIGALLFIGVVLTVLLDLALGNRDDETEPLVQNQGEVNEGADSISQEE
ncbi:scav-3, partial [Pristionchus pacificus]